LEISFSQGTEWKALISKYIAAIPLSGDAACVAEQRISGAPPPRAPVSSAMIAKVGAAARESQPAAPTAAAFPLPSIFFVPVGRGDIKMSAAAFMSRFG
jgi:hypothetical protein